MNEVFEKGCVLGLVSCEVKSTKTKPPSRYIQGQLVHDMEMIGSKIEDAKMRSILKSTAGIGTSATRSSIVTALINREYAEKKGKFIISTAKGRQLIHECPVEIKNPVTTALWEQILSEIGEGKRDPDLFMKAQIQLLEKILEKIKKDVKECGGMPSSKEFFKKESVPCLVCKEGQAVRLKSKKTQRFFWKCESCGEFFNDKEGNPALQG